MTSLILAEDITQNDKKNKKTKYISTEMKTTINDYDQNMKVPKMKMPKTKTTKIKTTKNKDNHKRR